MTRAVKHIAGFASSPQPHEHPTTHPPTTLATTTQQTQNPAPTKEIPMPTTRARKSIKDPIEEVRRTRRAPTQNTAFL